MSEPLFYCESLADVGGVVQLRGDEAHHALAARRLAVGNALWLFDGRGKLARTRVVALRDRRELDAIVEEIERQAAPAPRVHLACALPKGDRAAALLDMATQLGMTSFTPLLSQRSVVDPGAGTLDRLRRVSLEACKQSRRTHVPTIHAPAQFAETVARGGPLWIAHPGGKPIRECAVDQTVTIVVGPEGGFTDDEVADATRRGAVRVALGDGILRVETAAVALLAAVMLGPNGRTS